MMLVLKLATFFGETIEVTVDMCKQRSVHRINNTTVVLSRVQRSTRSRKKSSNHRRGKLFGVLREAMLGSDHRYGICFQMSLDYGRLR